MKRTKLRTDKPKYVTQLTVKLTKMQADLLARLVESKGIKPVDVMREALFGLAARTP